MAQMVHPAVVVFGSSQESSFGYPNSISMISGSEILDQEILYYPIT